MFNNNTFDKSILLAAVWLIGSSSATVEAVEKPHNIDLTVPKQKCLQLSEAIVNSDGELFKSIYIPIPVSDAEYQNHIEDVHNKLYKKKYVGISNFRFDSELGNKVFEDAKTSGNNSVQQHAERWGHNLEVWIGYTYDTKYRVDTRFGKAGDKTYKSDFCKLAYLNDNWYLINMVK